MNKQELVEYILGGIDFDIVTSYVLHHWDTKHKGELLHCLITQLEDSKWNKDNDLQD